jgi:hypothetical protein
MFEARHEGDVTVIRGAQELTKDDLAVIASIARRARAAGRRVIIDLEDVTHLHYAGAALLTVPGLRAAGASPYVKHLVHAGGAGGHVQLFDRLEDAFGAA